MIREVHPHEVLISTCIFVVLAACLFGGGYWLGHRDVHYVQAEYNALRDDMEQLYGRGWAEGWFDQDEPLRVDIQCHGDASDWSTIRMANQIGWQFDLPVFVHGNCQTHEVVDVGGAIDLKCRQDGVFAACHTEYAPAKKDHRGLPSNLHAKLGDHRSGESATSGNFAFCNRKGHENDQIRSFDGAVFTPPPCKELTTPNIDNCTECQGSGLTAQPSGNPACQCPDGTYREIENVPQPEGQ